MAPAASKPGLAVDRFGGDVVDPTKNVEDLVKALEVTLEKLRQSDTLRADDLRRAAEKYEDAMRMAVEKLHNQDRAAESKRVDQLAELRQTYETRIADMLRTSVESTSTLVSTQLVQIQNTFNERVAKLEQFRYESVGKAGVADPALAQSLAQLGSGLATIQTTMIESMSKMASTNADAMGKMAASISSLKEMGAATTGASKGQEKLIGWIVAVIMAAVAVATYISHPVLLGSH